jgi:hypothetical protein
MHDTVQRRGDHLRASGPRGAREYGDEQQRNRGTVPGTRHTDLQLDATLDDDGSIDPATCDVQ